jgi:hypothetical protein
VPQGIICDSQATNTKQGRLSVRALPPVCTAVGRLGVIYDSQAGRNAQKHHYKQVEALTFW